MKNIFTCILAATFTIFFAPASFAQGPAADSVKKIDVKVANLHCNNDMPTIKKRLLNQEGIDEVTYTDISAETSLFTISYHSSVTNQQQIEKTIESTPGCDDKSSTPYKVKRKKTKS